MIAVLAICAGAWWWISRDEVPATAKVTSVVEAVTVYPAEAARATAAPSPHGVAPMPPTTLPLRDSAASLRSRADAGDSLAACRLGVELLRCVELGHMGPDHDRWWASRQAELEAKGDDSGASEIAVTRSGLARLREECADVPEALVSQAHRYVRQAALAGEPEAMIRYAVGETLMMGPSNFAFLGTPRFDEWRREAPQVLMAALESGTPEAALLLGSAHREEQGYLAMLLPRDEVVARASMELTHRLFGEDPALPGLVNATPLQDEQAAEATRLAAEWHVRHFGGAQRVLADSTGALLPPRNRIAPLDGGPQYPGTPRATPCGDTRIRAP